MSTAVLAEDRTACARMPRAEVLADPEELEPQHVLAVSLDFLKQRSGWLPQLLREHVEGGGKIQLIREHAIPGEVTEARVEDGRAITLALPGPRFTTTCLGEWVGATVGPVWKGKTAVLEDPALTHSLLRDLSHWGGEVRVVLPFEPAGPVIARVSVEKGAPKWAWAVGTQAMVKQATSGDVESREVAKDGWIVKVEPSGDGPILTIEKE